MSSEVPILVKILSIGGKAAYSAGTKLFCRKDKLEGANISRPEVKSVEILDKKGNDQQSTLSGGLNLPAWAMMAMRATCRKYTDLPDIFGPVAGHV